MFDITPEFWDGALAVNLKHQFVTQAVARGMIAAGGGSVMANHHFVDAGPARDGRVHNLEGRHPWHDAHAGARTG